MVSDGKSFLETEPEKDVKSHIKNVNANRRLPCKDIDGKDETIKEKLAS